MGKTKIKFVKQHENLVMELGDVLGRKGAADSCIQGRRRMRQTTGEEGEMMMMSVDRQGEFNLLIS